MITIRKYGNRRLYDASASRYVNLEDLAKLIREGEQIKVADARTGEDLTQATLLQIISEVHGGGVSLPSGFLHRLIRYGGDAPWSKVLMQQFSLGLEMLDAQLAQLEQRFPSARPGSPAGSPAGGPVGSPAPEPPPEEPEEPAAPAAPADELSAMRERLQALERRLKK